MTRQKSILTATRIVYAEKSKVTKKSD